MRKEGDLAPFFTRPIAGVLAAVAILTILAQAPGARRLFTGKT